MGQNERNDAVTHEHAVSAVPPESGFFDIWGFPDNSKPRGKIRLAPRFWNECKFLSINLPQVGIKPIVKPSEIVLAPRLDVWIPGVTYTWTYAKMFPVYDPYSYTTYNLNRFGNVLYTSSSEVHSK